METREAIRYWAGGFGAAALVATIVFVVVMSRVPTPRPKAAPHMQAATTTQATVKPQTAVKPQTPPKSVAPALTAAERTTSEELWVEQKKLDTDSARVMAATSDGRRRVGEMIATQFNVPEKLVNDLRGRKIGYGEITAALALSQQLMKRDQVTRQQALDRVLRARKSGQGWAALARGLDLKVGDVLSAVKKTDKQLAKLVTLKAAAR